MKLPEITSLIPGSAWLGAVAISYFIPESAIVIVSVAAIVVLLIMATVAVNNLTKIVYLALDDKIEIGEILFIITLTALGALAGETLAGTKLELWSVALMLFTLIPIYAIFNNIGNALRNFEITS